MICDLNVLWPVSGYNSQPTQSQIKLLKSSLAVLEELGYTHVALNFRLSQDQKLPSDINSVNPIDLSLFKEFESRLKIFTRVTMIIDDSSQSQNIAKLMNVFDIVAVEPKTEKALLSCTTNLEIDLISFDFQNRLPCYLKHKAVCSAVEKGIYFEIKYSDLVGTSTVTRARVISNIKQLIRASRDRGLLCSSGSATSETLRNSNDIVNLLILFGLDSSRAQQCFKDGSLKVLLNGRLRIKSYKQVIAISGDKNLIDNSLENKDKSTKQAANIKMDAQSYRKRKKETALERQNNKYRKGNA